MILERDLRDYVKHAVKAEKRGSWSKAAKNYERAATLAASRNDFDRAAQLYMKAAVSRERIEDWRRIGLLWLMSASAMEESPTPLGSGLYEDADAAKHYFPVLSLEYWQTLSKEERLGRSLRNSGYHLEKAGMNQSAYKQYTMSGSAFSAGCLWDEASRSYLLAARSYIRLHGELSAELLDHLRRSLSCLTEENEARYLRRLILYYRHIRVDLAQGGNTDQANEVYIMECEARLRSHKRERHYLATLAYLIWRMTSEYGTSFNRWLSISIVLTLLLFPAVYLALGAPPRTLNVDSVGHSILGSMNSFLGNASLSGDEGIPLLLVRTTELACGWLMLGSLAAMIISRITR